MISKPGVGVHVTAQRRGTGSLELEQDFLFLATLDVDQSAFISYYVLVRDYCECSFIKGLHSVKAQQL